MSASDGKEWVQTRRALIMRALEAAEIKEFDSLTGFVGVGTFWRERGGEIELVFSTPLSLFQIRFNASVGLDRFANGVLNFQKSYDDDDVKLLVIIIRYIQDLITSIPGTVSTDLTAGLINRAVRLFESGDVDSDVRGEALDQLGRLQSALPELGKSSPGLKHRKALRAERGRGGNTRTKRDWLNPENFKRFAQRVDDRIRLVEQIKSVFRNSWDVDTWMEDLRRDRTVQLLSQDVPSQVLAWAAKRVADSGVSADEREPQAIACEMARQELGYDHPGSIGTLQEYYRKGKEMLRSPRRPPAR